MSLVKGTNSYATVAEADAYFVDRLDVAAWSGASAEAKGQALVTATSSLDEMSWEGVAVASDQPLAFPRIGSYYDPKAGITVSMPSGTPTRVLNATYELAYHLLNNDGLLDDQGSVTDLSVGSISLSIKSAPSKVPATVSSMVSPLLINNGATLWWRAN